MRDGSMESFTGACEHCAAQGVLRSVLGNHRACALVKCFQSAAQLLRNCCADATLRYAHLTSALRHFRHARHCRHAIGVRIDALAISRQADR
jgi:hypothetical protein